MEQTVNSERVLECKVQRHSKKNHTQASRQVSRVHSQKPETLLSIYSEAIGISKVGVQGRNAPATPLGLVHQERSG